MGKKNSKKKGYHTSQKRTQKILCLVFWRTDLYNFKGCDLEQFPPYHKSLRSHLPNFDNHELSIMKFAKENTVPRYWGIIDLNLTQKTLNGASKFVQNPVNTDHIFKLTILDVLETTDPSKHQFNDSLKWNTCKSQET